MHNTNKQTINIVLAADLNYQSHLQTLIKSICFHHQHVKFYLLHKEYSPEWFDIMNQYLSPLNSKIISAYVLIDFSQFKQPAHITESTYYRSLIQDIDEERLLYLDSDIIIDNPIDELYFSEFENNYIISIPDLFINEMEHWYAEFPDMKPYFNAGVILFNNLRCREFHLKERFFQLANNYSFIYADQDILNILLKDKWKFANEKFNYQVCSIYANNKVIQEKLLRIKDNIEPHIIHYTSEYKPWKNYNVNSILREKYWFYFKLSWEDIYQKHSINT